MFRLTTLVFLALLIVSPASFSDGSGVQIKSTYQTINTKLSYIVADDIKFTYDTGTRVYDKNNTLRSLQSLKPGHKLVMTFRPTTLDGKQVSSLTLDSILYSE